MKEHPILFTGPMVRAILEGRKTQTRRPIKPPKGLTIGRHGSELVAFDDEGGPACININAPFAVGDRLWVRETFASFKGSSEPVSPRLTLEVTGIRPERVKSIPQSDALAEGIEYRRAGGMSPGGSGTYHVGEEHHASTPKEAFACLWDSIYGDGPLAWQHNPWTWATTFKVVTP